MGQLTKSIRLFVKELRRRRVLRVAAVYAGMSFVVLQLGEILVEPFDLPGWTLRMVTLVIILGFPLTMGLTWVYDITEEGIVRTPAKAERSGGEETRAATFTATRKVTGGLLLVGIGLLFYLWIFSPGTYSVGILSIVSEESPPPAKKAGIQAENPVDRSIAVLPFEVFGQKEPGFTRGIHDELLARLSNVSSLKVIARTSVEQYRGTDKTISEIGKELGVGWVLEGAVQKSGSQIQVNAQLINARNDHHAWAESYRRNLTAQNLFNVQSNLVEKIVQSLEVELTPEDKRQVGRQPTDDLEAFRLYMNGRDHLDKRSEQELRRGIKLFRQAIDRDSTHALAWAGLADAQTLLASYGFVSRDTILSRALTAARRARTLAPVLSEAQASLGLIHMVLKRDGPAAARALKRAVDMDSNYVRARQWLGILRMVLGQPQEGLDHLERAAALDPLSPSVHMLRAASYVALDSTKKGVAAAQETVSLAPEYPSALMVKGYALTKAGRPMEGHSLLNRGLATGKVRSDVRKAFRGWPGVAYVRAGDTSRARAYLAELEKEDSWFAQSLVHASLGEVDAAFRVLNRAEWTYMSSILIRYDSVFSPLRDRPQYQKLVDELSRSWALPSNGRVPTSQHTS